MTPPTTRLRVFLDHKGLSIISLQKELGYKSPQKIYRLFNTVGASPSVQIVEDIARAYPELNLNWLFTGDGEMERIATYKNKDISTRNGLSMMLLQGVLSNPAYSDMNAWDAVELAIAYADRLIEHLKPQSPTP